MAMPLGKMSLRMGNYWVRGSTEKKVTLHDTILFAPAKDWEAW